jgi:hypothetical protein
MRHLSPEELIDVAEGATPRDAFPHLASCAACDRQVADLQAAMAAAVDLDVPERSPLFWQHLSARVREAVAAEATGRAAGTFSWWTWRVATITAAVAVLVVIIATTLQPENPPAPAAVVAENSVPAADELAAFDDDAALTVLADLTSELDWEAAAEAGLVAAPGAVEKIMLALDADERLELHRILEEALSASGA